MCNRVPLRDRRVYVYMYDMYGRASPVMVLHLLWNAFRRYISFCLHLAGLNVSSGTGPLTAETAATLNKRIQELESQLQASQRRVGLVQRQKRKAVHEKESLKKQSHHFSCAGPVKEHGKAEYARDYMDSSNDSKSPEAEIVMCVPRLQRCRGADNHYQVSG